MKLNWFRAAFAAVTLTLSAAFAAIPAQQAYIKASNTGAGDMFGGVIMSGDTLVVSTQWEDSSATGVNGDQNNNSAPDSGAVYIFVRSGTNWIQQAYLKASNTEANDRFGLSIAISGDTLVVGADHESSSAAVVNGDQNDNSAMNAGAAYVFVRNGTNWTQQAYLKPSNNYMRYRFGFSVAVSGDTILIGARDEDSNATGVNGNQTNHGARVSGAAYVFVRSGTNWTQQAYLKASNTAMGDSFGGSVVLSGDTAVVGAVFQGPNIGAAYVFTRDGTNWSQQAYLKGADTGLFDFFGGPIAMSGETLVIGASQKDFQTGAAYVFTRNGTNWSQQAKLSASNAEQTDLFGGSLAISGDTVAVGAQWEDSNATGMNGNQSDNSSTNSGAVYIFVRNGTNWSQQTYLKASNTGINDSFCCAAISGGTIAVGAPGESSNATGVNGNQNDNSALSSGAVYVFTGLVNGPQITALPDDNGGYFVRCNAVTGFTYQLDRSPSVTGPWTTLAIITVGASGPIEFHDTNAPPGQAFYRVAQP